MGLGFTARTFTNYSITAETSILNGFTEILENKGNHFQPSTGVFTAPVRGLYLVGLKHDEEISVPAQFDVVHESPNATGDGAPAVNVIAAANTAAGLIGGVSCIVTTVWMEEGDRLYVRLNLLIHGEFTLLAPSMFHCYLQG